MSDTEDKSLHHDFYTEERWTNWLNQVKQSDFKFEESEEPQGKEGAIFVNMEDDIILACLKIIAKYDRGQISADNAMQMLSRIRDIALAEVEPISEDADLMIDSLQTSLIGSFAACECYLTSDYDEKDSVDDLVKVALEAEGSDDIEIALATVAEIGALVLKGNDLSDKTLEEVPYGLVAEWLDGIESISAAMVGSDSYKEDEEDDEAC
ncbi:DUF2150 family protein [Methanolobus halotolerans]|uniref:DUF2150 domain-containing protein n=1 Tax=Methanolobus halotolerans TaxID=2052935 RepID=A0A4E0Q8T3_9EURY|nr:DUF2150 family protein [Methanolobus halotolerans]TGC11384.1 DUF2150 domain-containing protein [Methanolobus halotolerans]